MIGAPIPQDILKYEAKLVGNFSARETIIYGSGMAVAALVALKVLPKYLGTDIKIYIATAIIFLFFAWGKAKPYGQPLEKVIFPILEDNVFKPSVRIKSYEREEHERAFNKALKSSDIKDRAKRSKEVREF